MEQEERDEVERATCKALEMLKGSKREHKKGVQALLKLTGKREYVEVAASSWMAQSGASMTVDFLQNGSLEDEGLHELLDDHMRLLANVVRVDKLVRPLVELGLVEALVRVVAECPVGGLVMRSMRVIGLISSDAAAVKKLVAMDALAEIMSHVSIRDDAFLTSVLPRLLKDPKMTRLFCDHGGLAFLQGVMVFEDESSPQALAGAVAAISVLAKTPEMMKRMVAEEEFVSSLVALLSNTSSCPAKVKVLIIRSLYLLAQDPLGFSLVEPAVLPLMEIIEDRTQEALPATVAAFDLLGMLCNTADAIALVEQYGGEAFISYVLCFLASPKQAVVEPLCGLLHVLALGSHRAMIVDAMRKALPDSPLSELLTATLDIMGAGRSASGRASERSSETVLRERSSTIAATASAIRRETDITATVEIDLGVVERPERRATRESQTARQGAKRGNIVKEILSTERTYYAALFSVCKCFVDPMKKAAAGPKPVVTAAEMTVLFGNVDELYELHKNLLKKLDQRVKGSAPQANVADLFSTFADSVVSAYRPYYSNYPKAVALMAEKEKKTKGFRQMCIDLTKKIVRGGMSLENYLIMPVQRLPRYAMLLRELEKATIDVHPDKKPLGLAAAKLEEKLAELDRDDAQPAARKAAATIRFPANGTLNGSSSFSSFSFRPPNGLSMSAAAATTTAPIAATGSSRALPALPTRSATFAPSTSDVSSSLPKTRWEENYDEPPAQLNVMNRRTRLVSGVARVKSRQSRESMIYKSNGVAAEDTPPSYVAPNPIVTEGIVFEEHGRDEHSVRKMVLLREKLVVLTCPGADRENPPVFWDPATADAILPTTVHTFPLVHLRMEKDGRFGIRLFDTRKTDDPGIILSCETEQIVNAWIDVVFEAIYK